MLALSKLDNVLKYKREKNAICDKIEFNNFVKDILLPLDDINYLKHVLSSLVSRLIFFN